MKDTRVKKRAGLNESCLKCECCSPVVFGKKILGEQTAVTTKLITDAKLFKCFDLNVMTLVVTQTFNSYI